MKGQVKKNGSEYISVTTARTVQEGKKEKEKEKDPKKLLVCSLIDLLAGLESNSLPPSSLLLVASCESRTVLTHTHSTPYNYQLPRLALLDTSQVHP